MSLLGTRLVSVVEDDEENLGSNVEICVKLILSTDIPIERSVVVLLDIKDISTGLRLTCVWIFAQRFKSCLTFSI